MQVQMPCGRGAIMTDTVTNMADVSLAGGLSVLGEAPVVFTKVKEATIERPLSGKKITAVGLRKHLSKKILIGSRRKKVPIRSR